jgi:hypothetical protein
MTRSCLAVLALLTYAALGVGGPPPTAKPAPAKSNLIVHEWGTFLSVQGSDGVTLGGMVDSEEQLPNFVEGRSNNGIWERTQFVSKMETPVTYFYTDRSQVADVRVDMPKGVLTHWYPMVRSFGPRPDAKTDKARAGSFLHWRHVELIPPSAASASGAVPTLWRVQPGDPWRFARETDAAFVKLYSRTPQAWSDYDYEKFLFYRGLGTFDPSLQVVSQANCQDARLLLQNRSPDPLRGLFAIYIERGTLRFARLDDLAGKTSREVSSAQVLKHAVPLEEGVPELKASVAAALVSAGLYPKEAQAMVNTWERSYFRTEGLRVLYLLPRSAVDAAIPIQIKPAPDQLVRVMVGRVEVMTPAAEHRLVQLVTDLGASDAKLRQGAREALVRLGRFQEPMLRRVLALTNDTGVRTRAEALIARAARP